jgi:hypothetical protein
MIREIPGQFWIRDLMRDDIVTIESSIKYFARRYAFHCARRSYRAILST